MAPQLNEQRWYREILALVGTEVEVGLQTKTAVLTGKITNTMFDSFLLDCQGKNQTVRFEEVSYLLPRFATSALPLK